MWKLVSACLILLSSFFMFQQSVPSAPPKAYSEPEAYEIYSTILPEEWTWKDAKAKILAIRDQTVAWEMCLRPDEEHRKLLDPAIRDYVKKSETPWLLQSSFHIEKTYALILSGELEKAMKDGQGWESLLRLYPGSMGWLELSAVGFNEDKTVAVVYSGHHCGNLCGGGTFYVLQKKDGKWQALKWNGTTCGWAS
jgi:hypothetical protein